MHAEFKEIRPFIYQFRLVDIPFSISDILAEVDSVWATWPHMNNTRYKLTNFKNFGPIIKSLHTFFCSNDFQNQFINTIGKNELFWKSYWKHDIVQFKNKLSPIFEGDMDMTNFHMPPHLDNRALVAVGMCHFINGDDPNQSTTFYTTEHKTDPIRMPTGFGVGWACANLHNTWHSGQNYSDKNRFSIKFGSEISI
jgi:hypothetical protein